MKTHQSAQLSLGTGSSIDGTLPKVPAETPTAINQFEELYSGKHCKLEGRPTELGREVRLTLNEGSTTQQAAVEINERCQAAHGGRSAIYYPNILFSTGTKEVLEKPLVVTFISVVRDSADRVAADQDPHISHEALLKQHGFEFVSKVHQILAAGAFRVAKGFERGVAVGSCEDQGDLFEGRTVRSESSTPKNIIYATTDGRYGTYSARHVPEWRLDVLYVSGRTPETSAL